MRHDANCSVCQCRPLGETGEKYCVVFHKWVTKCPKEEA